MLACSNFTPPSLARVDATKERHYWSEQRVRSHGEQGRLHSLIVVDCGVERRVTPGIHQLRSKRINPDSSDSWRDGQSYVVVIGDLAFDPSQFGQIPVCPEHHSC